MLTSYLFIDLNQDLTPSQASNMVDRLYDAFNADDARIDVVWCGPNNSPAIRIAYAVEPDWGDDEDTVWLDDLEQ